MEEEEAPEINQREVATGAQAEEEDMDLNWSPSMPEEECSIDSDLQEIYIQMVQQGKTDEEWNNFCQQHKVTGNYLGPKEQTLPGGIYVWCRRSAR